MYCQTTSISIHAPTRGATRNVSADTLPDCISIHAPTRGATGLLILFELPQQFQSTLPQGERLFQIVRFAGRWIISIHAPTRGATRNTCSSLESSAYFNPRSHKGSDARSASLTNIYPISIHAPTRGATLTPWRHIRILSISIHAPTRGATLALVF